MSTGIFDQVKAEAAGRWPDILSQVAGIPEGYLDGKNHPCPLCGGEDRFRLIDPEAGAVLCNQCFSTKNGDGIASVAWHLGLERQSDAAKLIAEHLGMNVGNNGNIRCNSSPIDIVLEVCKRKRIGEYRDGVFSPRPDWLIAFGGRAESRAGKPVARVDSYSADGSKDSYFDLTLAGKGLCKTGGSAGMYFPGQLPEPGESWIICEGVKDAAVMFGLDHLAAGINGTRFKYGFAELFRGCEVVFVPDLDEVSQSRAEENRACLNRIASNVGIARLPGPITPTKGKDVRDTLRKDGVEAIKDAIESAFESCTEFGFSLTHDAKEDEIPKTSKQLFDVPGFVNECQKWILQNSFVPQPELALGASIIACGAAIAGKVMLPNGNGPNLQAVLISDSGSGKDRPLKLIEKIFNEAGFEKCMSTAITSDSALGRCLEEMPQGVVAIDEVGHLLSARESRGERHLASIKHAMLRLYSWEAGKDCHFKKYASKESNITIPNCCFLMLGATTPSVFRSAISSEEIDGGLLGRLLLFFGDGEADLTPLRESVPLPIDVSDFVRKWNVSRGDDFNGYADHGNLTGLVEPQSLEVTEKAWRIFESFAVECHARHKGKSDPMLSGPWSRAGEKAYRLALIYACSGFAGDAASPPRIDEYAAEWATQFAMENTQQVVTALNGKIIESEYQRQLEKTKVAIKKVAARKKGKPMRQSDITRATQWLSQKDRQDIMQTLAATGFISESHVTTKGRKATEYRFDD